MPDQRGNIRTGDISGNGIIVGHENAQNITQGAPDWQVVLKELHAAIAGLPPTERRAAQGVANDLEDEVAKPQPDKARVQHLLTTLKGWGGTIAEAVVKAAVTEVIKRALI